MSAAFATSEVAKPSVGVVLSPALHVVSEENARDETEIRKYRATHPYGRIHLRPR